MDHFKEINVVNLSQDSIKHQLNTLESSYKDARALIRATGEVLTEEDIQRKIVTLKSKLKFALADHFDNQLYGIVS